MDLGLKGKVALITGASKGIGLETAIHLANEGADVAICARNGENLKAAATHIFKKTGVKVLHIEADITIEEDCKRVVTETSEHFGRLDIVINNAGTSSAQPFEQVETELWQHDLDLKLFGAIHWSH
jgi:3-oxoacyl-[acyl-carrier protein] reductase